MVWPAAIHYLPFTIYEFSLVTASPRHVISRFKMNGRVLVLNASFEPVNVCAERRAVVMIFKGIARMEEHNGHMLHSARITMHAPSVIRQIGRASCRERG